jgi:hypothetical protein
MVTASPLGAGLGGLLVADLGSAGTIRLSGLSTVGLAAIGAVLVLLLRRRRRTDEPTGAIGAIELADRGEPVALGTGTGHKEGR